MKPIVNQPNTTPRGFGWTEEEERLLRRTLRVRFLDDERIEIETTTGSLLERGILLLLWVGISVAAAVGSSLLTTTVVAGEVQVSPAALLALAIVTFPLMLGFALVANDPPHPISFFPGTRWIVSHHPGQKALGRIDPAESVHPIRSSSIDVATTIGRFFLRTRIATSLSKQRRVRELILDRCTPTVGDEHPPTNVVALVGRELVSIPGDFYTPLVRYTRVVSVSPNTLVIRNGAGPFLAWAIWIAEFAIGFVLSMVNLFDVLPNLFSIGGIGNQLCEPLFDMSLFLIALMHSTLAYTYRRRHLLRTVVLDKQLPYLVYKDHLGEAQIPTSECTMSLEIDPRQKEDDEVAPWSLEIRHRENRLAKWTLKDPLASDEVAKTLDQGIREYLRQGRSRGRAGRKTDS